VADDLFALMDQVLAASQAVLAAYREAQAEGRFERAISLDLVLRGQSDAVLALAELLESEGTPYPPGSGPKGGRRLRTVA
jgi:hypothetical protein